MLSSEGRCEPGAVLRLKAAAILDLRVADTSTDISSGPALRDYLFAGHRSAEPAHAHVLTELGLEPLLDQRLRLGEASGAALALRLIGLAARVHAEMSRFAEAGVERADP